MKLLSLTFALILGLSACAQLTYTSSNYATGSYSIPMNTAATGLLGLDFDTTGANITWDYSGMGMDISGSKYTVTPAGSGYQAPFVTQCLLNGGGFLCLTKWNNLTNIGVVDFDTLDLIVAKLMDVMTMAKKSNSKLIGNIKGLKIQDSTGLVIPLTAEYSVADTIIHFPFTFQDSGTSKGAWGLDLNGLGQNIEYKVSYDRTWNVEGWGTLITPHQTHTNVLKVKTVLDQVDSIKFLTTPLGIARKTVEYTWYDATFGLPVMRAEGTEVGGITIIAAAQYYDTRVVGINENNELATFSLFPNPASDLVTFTNEKNLNYTYRIFSVQGKTVLSGKSQSTIQVSQLKPGVYFVSLTDANGNPSQVQRFVKQ